MMNAFRQHLTILAKRGIGLEGDVIVLFGLLVGEPGSKVRANLPKLIQALDNEYYAFQMLHGD
jgi:hypothetical protein